MGGADRMSPNCSLPSYPSLCSDKQQKTYIKQKWKMRTSLKTVLWTARMLWHLCTLTHTQIHACLHKHVHTHTATNVLATFISERFYLQFPGLFKRTRVIDKGCMWLNRCCIFLMSCIKCEEMGCSEQGIHTIIECGYQDEFTHYALILVLCFHDFASVVCSFKNPLLKRPWQVYFLCVLASRTNAYLGSLIHKTSVLSLTFYFKINTSLKKICQQINVREKSL